ncbi:hypothetical protein NKG94_34505 [Micromonospora sp. M12]
MTGELGRVHRAARPEPKTVRVSALTGSGAYGDVHADPVDVGPCVVDDTSRRVAVQTQDAEGSEAVSSTTVLVRRTPSPTGVAGHPALVRSQREGARRIVS